MGRKIGRKMIAFVVVVTGIQVFALQHYNSLLEGGGSGKTTNITNETSVNLQTVDKEIKQLQSQSHLVVVSPDQTKAAYFDSNNVLHFRDLQHNKDLSQTQISSPVQYIDWIRDDSLFVGEQSSPGSLTLETVQASTGQARVVRAAGQSSGSTFSGLDPSYAFKKIAYSPSTNDVYILIGSDSSSTVYAFDTNSNLTAVDLGGRYIKNIAVTSTGNRLYFEDYAEGSFNVLYDQDNVSTLIKRDAALIGTNDNTLYYGDINGQGLVTDVNKWDEQTETSQLVKTLSSPTLASQITLSPSGDVQVGVPGSSSTVETNQSNATQSNTTQ